MRRGRAEGEVKNCLCSWGDGHMRSLSVGEGFIRETCWWDSALSRFRVQFQSPFQGFFEGSSKVRAMTDPVQVSCREWGREQTLAFTSRTVHTPL